MKSYQFVRSVLAMAACGLLHFNLLAATSGTAFTYQGKLNVDGNAANGSYDLLFILYSSDVGGNQQGPILTNSATPVAGGLFTVTLDFGGVFDGSSRWLEIGVRTNGSSEFTPMNPRQPLTPTPYAISAGNLSGTVSASQLTDTLPGGVLSGVYSGALTLTNPANIFGGDGSSFTFGGFSYCGLPCYWKANGNSGTTPGANFVGTTDNQPLEFKVFNQRAMRLEPTTNSPNIIGGYFGNFVNSNTVGGTIGGGGYSGMTNYLQASYWFPGHPTTNALFPHFGTISGGGGNYIQAGSFSSIGGGGTNIIANGEHINDTYMLDVNTIGGGLRNWIGDSRGGTIGGGVRNGIEGQIDGNYYSTISGGVGNDIDATGDTIFSSTIGGGATNLIHRATWGTIGGGGLNFIGTMTGSATIAGGARNVIDTSASGSTIAGGSDNYVEFYCSSAAIGGGISNRISGPNFGGSTRSRGGVIGGGYLNLNAGSYSFIGGGSNNVVNAGANQAVIAGGASNSVSGIFATIPGGCSNTVTGAAGFAAGYRAKSLHDGAFVWADKTEADFSSTNTNSFSARCVGGAQFVSAVDGSGAPAAGVVLTPGSGSWTTLSDRNSKDNFEPVQSEEILDRLASMPISTWNYKAQDKSIRHIGPMAQDFAEAFHFGDNDKGITTVDADGVALAAIQGLNKKLEAKETEIRELKRDITELRALVKAIAKRPSEEK